MKLFLQRAVGPLACNCYVVGEESTRRAIVIDAGSIGRTDLPGGDTQVLLDAVRSKLFILDEGLVVYPGHGPTTTLAAERAHTIPSSGTTQGLTRPNQSAVSPSHSRRRSED